MSSMHTASQKLLAARVGKVTAILSSATMSLLLVGTGCAPAPAANVSVDAKTPVTVPPIAPPPTPEEEVAPAETKEPAKNLVEPSATAPATGKYKNGTYGYEGYYRSPAGSERIEVTLVLKNDKIVSVNVSVEATNPKSVAMQKAFAGGISAVVVGKSIDEVNVGKVAGSSLTGTGFNDAIAKIKVEAKS